MKSKYRVVCCRTVIAVCICTTLFTGQRVRGEEKPLTPERRVDGIPGVEPAFEMVRIRAGEFWMGSADADAGARTDEKPARRVHVDAFWMLTHEITWEQFLPWTEGELPGSDRIAVSNVFVPEDISRMPRLKTPPTFFQHSFRDLALDGRRPAVGMTQWSAKLYCYWLSLKSGRFYRLPTEAEWEYACRAGSRTAYFGGDEIDGVEMYAWVPGEPDEDSDPHFVCGKEANPWGLYDIIGNAMEWVGDGYHESYPASADPVRNPIVWPRYEHVQERIGMSTVHRSNFVYGIARGGSIVNYDAMEFSMMRSAARRHVSVVLSADIDGIDAVEWSDIPWIANSIGFRIVRPVETPPLREQLKHWGIHLEGEHLSSEMAEFREYWSQRLTEVDQRASP